MNYRLIGWGLCCMGTLCCLGLAHAGETDSRQGQGGLGASAEVGRAVQVGEIADLRAVAEVAATRALPRRTTAPVETWRGDIPRAGRASRRAQQADPVAQRSHPSDPNMPVPVFTFDAVHNLDGVAPPDPNGDVGVNQYIAMANYHFCIYDKQTGAALIAPMLMSSLYAAAGFPAPASNTDNGDPIVLYDHLAGRWMISQFLVDVTPCHEVIAISKSEDATGGWYLYDFVMPNDKMNDYPHFGLWPDGYYMSDNQFNTDNSWGGAGVFVFDRAKMLVGDTNATYQYFDLDGVSSAFGGMLPCDLDGPPPPDGTPNLFGMVDQQTVNPVNAFYIWEFRVDWTNPANSTFGSNGQPDFTNEVAAFNWDFPDGRNTIPQPGTAQKLDPISDRIMHRLQYRNFGSHESLVANHTVNVGAQQAGVRYYELRRPSGGSFGVHEQATFAPDGACRWMGSAALDSQGNLAVGYSVSATNVYPSIRYAGRLATDPANGLHQGEAELWTGTASQTGTARWGDYTSLSVDPVDGVTFWYMNQYTTGAWNWRTRVGSFRLTAPSQGRLEGVVTNTFSGQPVAGAVITIANLGYITGTDASGRFGINLPTGTCVVVATADQYVPATNAGIDIFLDTTTTVAVGLSPFAFQVRPGEALTATGSQGGPFAPSSKTYALTNESAGTITWTATWSQAWVDVEPSGGELEPGGGAQVCVSLADEVAFLHHGSYQDNVLFTNLSGMEAQARTVNLTIEPCYILREQFESGLPAGWSVRTNGDASAYWRFDDPCGEGNLTGSTGIFAMADSDCAGETTMNTELRTPLVDLGEYTNVWLAFNSDFRAYSESEVADVDYSTNGATGPWINIWRKQTDARGPSNIVLRLPLADRSASTMVRFHYFNAYFDYWWEVDNVRIYGDLLPQDLAVAPSSGLDASGYYGGPFSPAGLSYLLANNSVVPLAWTARHDCAWLDVAPLGGVLEAGGTRSVTVAVNHAATLLMPGTHAGALVFTNLAGGSAQTRAMTLTIHEPVAITPASGFNASGLEEGPFTPDEQVYLLDNHSVVEMEWTSSWSAAWLNVAPAGGTLAAGSAASTTVSLVDGELTAPGVHEGFVTFSNRVTGAACSRAVTVTVIEISGAIGVFDSIPPTNDLQLPFGVLAADTQRVEHITVRNLGENERDLVVSNIYFGYYREDFSEDAAGWKPTVPEQWCVTQGEYRASSAGTGFMVSAYLPQTWSDCSMSALMRRSGNAYRSEGLFLRATPDFDGQGGGSAYLFLWSGSDYSVWLWQGAQETSLQGWTLSTAIKPGTNTLTASASGNLLRFAVNNTLVWEGTNNVLTDGHVGLVGYTDAADPALHYFDNVQVGRPVSEIIGLGRKQLYLNGRPQAKSSITGVAAAPREPASDVADNFPAEPAEPMSSLFYDDGFAIANLPALPAVLTPGQSFTFDVVFAPNRLGSNDNIVSIHNNDNDDPVVNVEVSGRVASGRMVGQVLAEHSGQPVAGAMVAADFGTTNFTSTTDAQGLVSMEVFTGTFDLSAAMTHYATAMVAGLVIPENGVVLTQNFSLVGSLLDYAPTSLAWTVAWPGAVTNTFLLSNSGPFAVEMAMQATASGTASETNALFACDVSTPAGDSQCLGVEYDGVHFWVTGGGSNVNPNYLYQFDTAGNMITSYVQGTSSDWGWRDLAFDGTNLYASDSTNIQQISRVTGQATGVVIPGPQNPCRALAYDPASDHFWVANFTSSVYEINRAGTVLNTYTNTRNIYGLAWDDLSEGGPWLWVWSQDGTSKCRLSQFDPRTGQYTGVGREGFNPPGGDAGGACFGNFDGTLAVVGLHQADSDILAGYVVGFIAPSWTELSTNAALLPPGGTEPVELVFDSSQVTNTPGTYSAFVRFSGDFVNDVAPLPLSMVVPGMFGASPTSLAYSCVWGQGDPASQAYCLTNLAGDTAFSNEVVYGEEAAGWFSPGAVTGQLAFGGAQVFTGEVISAGLDAGIYTATNLFRSQDGGRVIGQLPVTLTIHKAAPAITWTNPSAIVYGTALGATQLNAVADVPGAFEYTPTNGTRLNAGEGQTIAARFTPDDLTNYVAVTSSVPLDVLPAPLTATADDQIRHYGETNPVLTISYSGFVLGQDQGNLHTQPAADCAAVADSPAGDYDIVLSGGSDTNYAVTLVDGTLTVLAVPPGISAPFSSNVLSFQADLGCEITALNGAQAVERGVVWSADPGFLFSEGTRVSETGTFGTGVFTVPIADLSAGRTHYFMAFAINPGGTNHTVTAAFLTRPPAPVAALATNITIGSFDANWLPATGAETYFLDVATNSHFSSLVTGYENLDVGNILTHPVTGLTAGAQCYYRIRAANATGAGPHSATQSVWLIPPAPVAEPATDLVSDGFTANWQFAAGAEAYLLDIATSNTFLPDQYVTGYSNRNVGTVRSWQVSGLSTGIVCYYRLRAQNTGGTSAPSEVISVAREATLTLACSPLGAGSTLPAPGAHQVNLGQAYSILAMPEGGFRFCNWMIVGNALVADTNSADTEISVAGDCAVTAFFERRPALTGSLLLLLDARQSPVPPAAP